MIGSKLIVVVCTAFALAIGACKKDDPDRSGAPKEPSATRAAPSDKAPVPPSTGEPRARPAEQMLAAYERARALLAADDTTGLADVAGEMYPLHGPRPSAEPSVMAAWRCDDGNPLSA